ncbi:MAG TPA: VanW family protein [Caulobacteraceae bacterium]
MTGTTPQRVQARPSRLSSLVYAAKVTAFRTRRAAIDAASGPPRLIRLAALGPIEVAAESRTPLWSDPSAAEQTMQLGKVHNLRIACRALDELIIPAGAIFSFWRQVGPPIASRGYVQGRMLQQGCMVAVVGGGLCQLSNALYDVALQAGCRIVERHPHSRIVLGSAAEFGRDATVAWNYVDLRFVSDRALRLSARLDQNSLCIRLAAPLAGAAPPAARSPPPPSPARSVSTARSCASCDETDCFLHEPSATTAAPGVRAFLVDEAWPEFQDHVRTVRGSEDRLGLPFAGARLGLARYAWPPDGFEHVRSAPIASLRRTLALRGVGPQGSARRAAELVGAGRISAAIASLLTPEVTTVTVAQSYLPYLWRDGLLGGREVSVLMSRLPLAVLQARLDAAAAAHPQHPSLADFRAPAWLAQAEAEALAEAAWIITPHAEIANLFGQRTVRLPWWSPPQRRTDARHVRRIAFVGPTVARKGAHLVREAALALGLEVMPLGPELEGDAFWRGVRIVPTDDWTSVTVVVQPALVEDQPRRLLAALAAGVPVVATEACGIDPQAGLTLIPPNDPAALIKALEDLIAA